MNNERPHTAKLTGIRDWTQIFSFCRYRCIKGVSNWITFLSSSHRETIFHLMFSQRGSCTLSNIQGKAKNANAKLAHECTVITAAPQTVGRHSNKIWQVNHCHFLGISERRWDSHAHAELPKFIWAARFTSMFVKNSWATKLKVSHTPHHAASYPGWYYCILRPQNLREHNPVSKVRLWHLVKNGNLLWETPFTLVGTA